MPHFEETDQQPPSDGKAQDRGLPELAPDAIEQEQGDTFDDIIPTQGYDMMPVVGLGGSAGSLAALHAFFEAMPPDSGMAFVVILHLSPEYESILAQLLQRSTPMPVRQVQTQMKVEPNHVYVIPPARHLSLENGYLELTEMAHLPGRHVAVDLFFRTLADTHGAHSVAIVLSGADGDGAIGLKRVKERGGLTIVQDPDEAEQGGMPRSAIATRLVDWVLPAAEMPARLLEYWSTESRLQMPVEPEALLPASAAPEDNARSLTESALHDILGFLRVCTGHDFTFYKRATVLRRVGRRMLVNGIESPQAYLGFLRLNSSEPDALLRDLLISVTNFFRDRDAFVALEAMMPAIFGNKGAGDSVRVWVAACATGEEAYSVAMMLCEYAARLERPPKLQVFATDLDERAIQSARNGLYPETIAADVSEDRLRRFFTKEHGGYRISREVREIVLFALHDLLKDSPFSRLDLASCRNLLIYFNRDAQTKALDIFHFALRPEGTLFLGSSEAVDDGSPLFAVVDKKRRLYTRCAAGRTGLPIISERSPMLLRAMHRPLPPHNARGASAPRFPARAGASRPSPGALEASIAPGSWSDLHYEFIERLGPPSVLVNHDHQIVHISERAGRYLQFGGGNVSMNLVRLVHPMLRIELRALLYRASQGGEAQEARGIPVEFDGARQEVNLRVIPSHSSNLNFLLVLFEEQEATQQAASAALIAESEPAMQQLEREFEQTKLQLRNVVEQSNASDEELKASNEELQAMNEELSTVNQELKSKVEELGRSNSDLQNLMAATHIATVFLDRNLCIQRYTPPAVTLFRLIPTDIGRPLEDLTPRLNYPNLKADAQRVLDELAVTEVEVAHADGRYFLARMLPYRTTENVIAGVVMTFVDITQRRKAEEGLRHSEARFRTVSNVVPDLLFSTDAEGKLNWCNQRWLSYTGQTTEQAQGFGWIEIIHPEDAAQARQGFQAAIERGEPFRSQHRLLGANGQARWFLVRAEPLRDTQGKIVQWFGAKTDIEDFKRASADLATSEERLSLVIENAREFAIFSTDLDLRVTSWNSGADRLLGFRSGEILGQSASIIFTPEDRAAGAPQAEAGQALAEGRATDERWHQRKDGSRFWGSGAMMLMRDPQGQRVGFVKILHDQTQARQAREALEKSREELLAALRENEHARAEAEAAGRAKDHFLAVLSHELRTPLTPVVMATHILLRNREIPATAREPLLTIQRNVRIETLLIDDLLDITRISRGKLEIVREPMDLHDAVSGAVEIAANDMQAKNQKLTVKLDASEHQLQGDANRLRQVFWNLLKNASKFTPPGGSIWVASRNEPGRVVVEVSDTGIGFEAEAATRIFESFAQGGENITREFGGLGLGLAISKAAVDAHGGVLSAHSEGAKRGATFIVTMPL